MRVTGNVYEDRACAALQRAGLALLDRNFATRHGELDLVMLDGATLVFVEVRYRRSALQGDAAASVTPAKQAKLIRAAQNWLASHPRHARLACRFDVIAYDGHPGQIRGRWLKAAFDQGA